MVANPRWDVWVRRKIREKRIYPAQMRWGGAYLFYYEPDPAKEPDHGPQDMMPMAIITRMYGGRGFMAINLIGIPTRYRQRKLIEAFMDAIAEKNSRDRIRKMLNIERMVRSNKETVDAWKFYSRSRIKGRIVEVAPNELQELVDKRILDVR